MISQPTIERLEREAFRAPLLTLAALMLIATGLAIIGLAAYFWVDLSGTANSVFSIPPGALDARSDGDLALQQHATLASRAEWLSLLPYQGLALMLGGVALLMRRWIAAVRLRMTVSALILPSLRNKNILDPEVESQAGLAREPEEQP